jgi:hypothetical protein
MGGGGLKNGPSSEEGIFQGMEGHFREEEDGGGFTDQEPSPLVADNIQTAELDSRCTVWWEYRMKFHFIVISDTGTD